LHGRKLIIVWKKKKIYGKYIYIYNSLKVSHFTNQSVVAVVCCLCDNFLERCLHARDNLYMWETQIPIGGVYAELIARGLEFTSWMRMVEFKFVGDNNAVLWNSSLVPNIPLHTSRIMYFVCTPNYSSRQLLYMFVLFVSV
jgi:hypothetical protein